MPRRQPRSRGAQEGDTPVTTSTTSEDDASQEPTRKGRSNAILTYEKVDALFTGLSGLHIKLDHLYEKFSEVRNVQYDHAARVRALELSAARMSGDDIETRLKALEFTVTTIQASRGTATWLWTAIWPVAGVIIAALGYFANH